MLMSAVGDYIQARRKVLGIRQKELAERVKRAPSIVSEWESGGLSVPFELIEPLAKALEEKSPLTLYEKAGYLKDLPQFDLMKELDGVPEDQLIVLRSVIRAFLDAQKKG